jgi:CubicO group peptidase (beta-lactamase class C family)
MGRTKAAIVVLLMAQLLSGCLSARKPVEPVVIDPVELQTFADRFFAEQLEALHIPGLVFVFVQGGEVVYAQGYGYADLESVTPMDAGASVMRIGSVSKPFVATAVMQLIEQGKLDLDTDVNQYLKAFSLEDTYPEPVRLGHLLTHRAGFEDPPYTSNLDPQQVEPLGAHLATSMLVRSKKGTQGHPICCYGNLLDVDVAL